MEEEDGPDQTARVSEDGIHGRIGRRGRTDGGLWIRAGKQRSRHPHGQDLRVEDGHHLDTESAHIAGECATPLPMGGGNVRGEDEDHGVCGRRVDSGPRGIRSGQPGCGGNGTRRRVLLGGEGARHAVLLFGTLRDERATGHRLALQRRRVGVMGGNLRPIQPDPHARGQYRLPDGGLVQEGNQHRRRPPGTEDADTGPGGRRDQAGGRFGHSVPRRRDLHQPRTRRHRRHRMDRPVPRLPHGILPGGPVLLLSWLA